MAVEDSRPLELIEAAMRGMALAYNASQAPERMALLSRFGRRTFGELNGRVNQLARALREAGIAPGGAVAVLARNRPELMELLLAALRTGCRATPINWHLLPDEVAYIVDDCEAQALVADAEFAAAAKHSAEVSGRVRLALAVDGEIDGFDDYDSSLAAFDGSNIDDPILGTTMLYTSGTTGHPKGVFRRARPAPTALQLRIRESAALSPGEDTALVTGPLYHAAPLGLNLTLPLAAGVGAVLMDKWDAEETLALVERHRITHTHMVATMFHRLLQLPDEVRSKYDLSSLRWIVHGAAPTPVEIKRRMIEWLGPIVVEYYAATEGGSFWVEAEEWLKKPGSVGRPVEGTDVRLLDDDGEPVPAGSVGTVYFKAPEVGRFEYFKAPEKTAAAYRGDFFTMGDMGYFDDDGYLFLTGRSAETIIAGGVNIYPQEIDNVLVQHPAVHEVCTIGVPNDEWGESVWSVVEVAAGFDADEELAAELLEFCRRRLPDFKRPRGIDFATELPRLPTGKILRRRVREPYWEGHEKAI